MTPWINHEWDRNEPACVRCGHMMYLRDGYDWHDDPRFNVCGPCAGALLEEAVTELEQKP